LGSVSCISQNASTSRKVGQVGKLPTDANRPGAEI
jgi:hypothetical protein